MKETCTYVCIYIYALYKEDERNTASQNNIIDGVIGPHCNINRA